jgi:hypothetical protein
MATTRIIFYPHRQNRDGSFDSICPKCFTTVANAKEVTQLNSYQKEHICDESFLTHRVMFSRKRFLMSPMRRITRS